MAKVGAPKGGRVHWLLINLPLYVKKNYYVNYNYPYHDYCIHRKLSIERLAKAQRWQRISANLPTHGTRAERGRKTEST